VWSHHVRGAARPFHPLPPCSAHYQVRLTHLATSHHTAPSKHPLIFRKV
jgi:hypothetical protein